MSGKYHNLPLNMVNDHIIRISIMTLPYYWHYHPNSDESFLCLEGQLIIELQDQLIELSPGQLYTIPANVLHRTRPKGERSVNLSFELESMQTIKKEPES
ncbi:cupin domain-containing protein [Pedobacter heparinus]|uniref:Cupin 2 conserved barrel domain protein n=1 Tax=Pedobacter heparinus (strain ATCC 13125 / DSM 2366 / CIP 104194 / JCM 7457 / NBRC 12017 / NCIMB 9290 / NRRL B-14731 / HIM 762-3) TaxID=485917 RepID=C6Y0B1_PEDHD|nr:cupin domain-containing protein [Pedobacter heparinus]ACU04823.1 Cupin 2 conserved barrel domain protein [Pedobacter heparinus DSM 2366]